MDFNETFFRFITAEYLYMAASIFGIFTLLIVAAIYLFLFTKKRRFLYRKQLNEELEDWISEHIAEGIDDDFSIPDNIAKNLRKKDFREFTVDKLITIKKNLDGSGAKIIIELYNRLGLFNDSLKRMRNAVWDKKARGIYELYMMEQKEIYPQILKYTNSSNIYVRREAQTAIIGFSGFDGLAFLDTLTHPILEWQQIKLLEQLKVFNMIEMPNINSWLQSKNEFVVIFALKLAELYQQFQTHDVIVSSLQHPYEKVRFHAIRTLGNIYNENTAEILKKQYQFEVDKNKREILVQICSIGTPDDKEFLLDKLNEEDDFLKLEAARAIARINDDGISILNAIGQENEVIASITKQIEYELAA